MECTCGGVVNEGKSSYRVSQENFVFIFENIPAFKCVRCDKVLFADEVADRIQKMVRRLERETTEIVTGKPSVRSSDF